MEYDILYVIAYDRRIGYWILITENIMDENEGYSESGFKTLSEAKEVVTHEINLVNELEKDKKVIEVDISDRSDGLDSEGITRLIVEMLNRS